MSEQTTNTVPSSVKEEWVIREKMKRELKEGDLVEIFLKDTAIVIHGIYPAIITDPMGRSNRDNKFCIGYVSSINEESISLRQTINMQEEDRGLDVFYFAIQTYGKAPAQSLVI
jgi:hypothetical protein